MKHAEIDKFCRSLKGATLTVQWGEERVFKVGGKMFAMLAGKNDKPYHLYFKAGETSFFILTHVKHIIPAPYLAKSHWVYLERLDALGAKELKAYLVQAHALIASGLSRKRQIELGLESLSSQAERKPQSGAREGKGAQVRTRVRSRKSGRISFDDLVG